MGSGWSDRVNADDGQYHNVKRILPKSEDPLRVYFPSDFPYVCIDCVFGRHSQCLRELVPEVSLCECTDPHDRKPKKKRKRNRST